MHTSNALSREASETPAADLSRDREGAVPAQSSRPSTTRCDHLALAILGGCASYRTPGGGADFSVFTDADIRTVLEREPAARFPASIAVARVQEPRYRSYAATGYGDGRYSVVTARDVETQEDFDRIANMPHVVDVVALNRLLLTEKLESDRPTRRAAASLHADLLLLYTFDTSFFVEDSARPLTVLTLGLSPNKHVRVATTVSAVLLHVRTGYVHGACESTARRKQLASAWTSGDAVDRFRRQTEREAFEGFINDFEDLWQRITSDLPAAPTASTG